MSNKCENCGLVNFNGAETCARCRTALARTVSSRQGVTPKKRSRLAVRAGICILVLAAVLVGFYLSLIGSASTLSSEEKRTVHAAVDVLRERGFDTEVALLTTVTSFRSSDNWLNASVPKENAYAATNFPFEIMTLYPDFFTYPKDDVERAAILLHEAKHLEGKNEHDAYEFVWKNRTQLGWTGDKYQNSVIWQNVRRQTRDNVPEMFICDLHELNDCTEPRPLPGDIF